GGGGDGGGGVNKAGGAQDQQIRRGDVRPALGKFGAQPPPPVQSLKLTNIEVKYWTGTGAFFFTCEGDFTVDSTPVKMVVTVDIKPLASGNGQTPKKYESKFGGKIAIGPVTFNLLFDTRPDSTIFIATYSQSGSVSIHDLVAALSPDLASGIPTSLTVDLKDVKFVFFQKTAANRQYAFGFDLSSSLSLSDLPLVGDKLPPDLSVGIKNLQFLYGSQMFDATQTGEINPLLAEVQPAVQPLPATVSPGINISAQLLIGSEQRTLLLAGGGQQQTPAQSAPA